VIKLECAPFFDITYGPSPRSNCPFRHNTARHYFLVELNRHAQISSDSELSSPRGHAFALPCQHRCSLTTIKLFPRQGRFCPQLRDLLSAKKPFRSGVSVPPFGVRMVNLALLLSLRP
jgi:hypothetical protein